VPVVTDIKRQRRVGSTRFNILLDGEYAFALSDLELSNSGLRVGQELSAHEVEEFRGQAGEAKAYALALRFLGIRQRSRRELMDYLVGRKDCDHDEAEAALERLERLGLVDDLRFAQAWIADRQAVRPRSKIRLAQELAAKGISRDVADQALAAVDLESEVVVLRKLIERKRRLPAYRDQQKLTNYLMRQGYRYDLIKEALEDIE